MTQRAPPSRTKWSTAYVTAARLCRRASSGAAHPLSPSEDHPDVAARKIALESRVETGQRSPESLLLISKEVSQQATVKYPADAFGPPEDW